MGVMTTAYVVFMSFELHAVSSTCHFRYMWFPVTNYPPFLLHVVSSSFVLHTVSFTRSFHHCTVARGFHCRFHYPRSQCSLFIQILVMGSERQAHEVLYCPSRSSKVIDFVLVPINSNFDRILHRFRDKAA